MSNPARQGRGLGRWASSAAGVTVALIGAGFLGFTIADEWVLVRQALVEMRIGPLAAAMGSGVLGMGACALCWRRSLRLVGLSTSRAQALRWYFVGQLGKYVPGGIWSVVGPAELAVGGGAARPRGYGAILLATGAIYLAGVITTAGLMALDPTVLFGSPNVWWILALLPLGVIAVHPRFLGFVLSGVRRILRRPVDIEIPEWEASLLLVAFCIPAWLGIGLSSWFIAASMAGNVPVVNLMLATVLAWVVGFLVVPAPAGLGVRETVFVMAATSLSPGIAAAVAVVARVLFMLVDAVLAASFVLLRIGNDGPVSSGKPPGSPVASDRT